MLKLDMSNEDYHAHSAISRSGLALLDEAPRKYWWKYLSGKAEPESSDALRIGSIFHTMVLEPQEFDKRVIVWSGASRATKTGKEEYAAAEADGRLIAKQAEIAELKDMVAAILAEPAAKKIISGKGLIEASYFWDDQESGEMVKCRPDYVREDGIVVDLKTCRDASPDAFSKAVHAHHYDIQAHMAMEAVQAETGKRPSAFVFIAVEKDPPYLCGFYMADEMVLASGAARYQRLMQLYAECKKANLWPGYGRLIQPVSMPDWYVNKFMKGN